MDGKLIINVDTKKATLQDEDGKFLEQTVLTNVSNLEKLEDFETPTYLIQIDALIKSEQVSKPIQVENSSKIPEKKPIATPKTFQTVNKAFKLPTKTNVPKEGRDEDSLLSDLIEEKVVNLPKKETKVTKPQQKSDITSFLDLDDDLFDGFDFPFEDTKKKEDSKLKIEIQAEEMTPKKNVNTSTPQNDELETCDEEIRAPEFYTDSYDESPPQKPSPQEKITPPKPKNLIIDDDDEEDSFFDEFDDIKDNYASESVTKEKKKQELIEKKDKSTKKETKKVTKEKEKKISINQIVNTVNRSTQSIIFPDYDACKYYSNGTKLKREVIIPDQFKNLTNYSNTFLDAIFEQTNLEMFELALKFREVYNPITKLDDDGICPNHKTFKCKYDQKKHEFSCTKCSWKQVKNFISNPKQREHHFRVSGIPYYTQCEIFQSKNKNDNSFFIKIEREKDNVYAKDDLWILSPEQDFNKDIMICKSLFHGPNANGLVQLKLLFGKYQKHKEIEAIRGPNLATNLEMIENLKNMNGSKLPLLYQFLGNDKPELNELKLNLSKEDINKVVEKLIEKYKLNQDQKTVLNECEKWFNGDKSEKSILLIHGIFGSGKSFLLVVLIIFISEILDSVKNKDIRILISSVTNVAVDNILTGLLNLGFTNFARVGSQKKIAKSILPFTVSSDNKSNKELLKEYKEMMKDPMDEQEAKTIKQLISDIEKGIFEDRKNSINQCRVVGVTAAATSFPILKDSKFSILILDESSQCLEPLALLPISRFQCKKLILCGDPLQLPPTLSGVSDDPKNSIEKTIFIRLANVGFQPLMLHTQYRCHPMISSLSNELFYSGKIKNGITEKDRESLIPGLAPIVVINAIGKEVFSSSSVYNNEEIRVVLKLVNMLIEYGIEETKIGVISLYHTQTFKLSNELKHYKGIKVSTVDAFQGGEKEIIILSCVRTNSLEFIESEKRLNVAISRAKRHLIIVCSQSSLEKGKFYNFIFERAKKSNNGILQGKDLFKHKSFDFLNCELNENEQELLDEIDNHEDFDLSSVYKRKLEEGEEEMNKKLKI